MKKATHCSALLIKKLLPLALAISFLAGCNLSRSDKSETDFTTVAQTEAQTEAQTQLQPGQWLNGVSLSEYSIVYAEGDADYTFRAAKYIQSEIFERTGLQLPVQADYKRSTSEYEIVVGDTQRQISKDLDADTQNLQFAITADETDIAMEGDYFIIAAAAYFFVETYIPDAIFESTVPQKVTIHEPIVKEAKNYIILIGDGMGFNQTALFEKYPDQTSKTRKYSDQENLFYGYYFPNQGEARTNSLSGVTDSAAGGTALATGYKTINKYVGKNESGENVQSLTELASSLNKATAVMSTDLFTGATPASFTAHTIHRDNSDSILAYQEKLTKEQGTLISCEHNDYDSDGVEALESELTRILTELEKNENGFFMMYEEGHIDKHCHDNNIEKTFQALVRFNQVIGRVMEHAFYNPDTFVLITADHETGGLQKSEKDGFYYTSGDHSGVNVPVFAYGWNAELFNERAVENTQIPKTIARMMGVADFGDNDGFNSLIK